MIGRRGTATHSVALVAVLAALLACKKKVESNEETPTSGSPSPAAAAAGDLAGSYKIASASNPGGGSSYQGSVDIAKVGTAYKLDWKLAGQPGYTGVGLVEGNVLGVGWGTGSSYGVVVYQVDGGTLKGRWAMSDASKGIGTEMATGPEGLSGNYDVSGSSPQGGSGYKGTLQITPTGPTYKVAWRLTSGESYTGVGILQGKTLVVGWGIGGSAGVVLYNSSGTTLDGKWAQPDNSALGTEKLSRM
ncbi:MAG: hypothetical protein R3B13_09555 [Polyangiaceae bacterium]